MKPSELSLVLASTIAARLPVLIIGGPGIGKTSIAKQACATADADLVVSHPALADPTDAKGFPWMRDGDKEAHFIPFGDTARVLRAKKLTAWLMDDLGQAPPSVQASYMPWLLERQVNGNRLPDHVVIIAATNRRTDRAGVAGILEPVKSRFAMIIELEPDLTDWCQWAIQQTFIPPELVAFLRFREGDNLLYKFEPSADLKNCPTPRTWEWAGRILQLGLPPHLETGALAGAVGEGAATELVSFIQMYRQLPNIDAILMDPDKAMIPTQLSALYAVSTALASKANDRNFTRVAKYAQRMVDAGHGEFASMLLLDSVRRTPSIQQTPAFVKLTVGELGQLIGGAIS